MRDSKLLIEDIASVPFAVEIGSTEASFMETGNVVTGLVMEMRDSGLVMEAAGDVVLSPAHTGSIVTSLVMLLEDGDSITPSLLGTTGAIPLDTGGTISASLELTRGAASLVVGNTASRTALPFRRLTVLVNFTSSLQGWPTHSLPAPGVTC